MKVGYIREVIRAKEMVSSVIEQDNFNSDEERDSYILASLELGVLFRTIKGLNWCDRRDWKTASVVTLYLQNNYNMQVVGRRCNMSDKTINNIISASNSKIREYVRTRNIKDLNDIMWDLYTTQEVM